MKSLREINKMTVFEPEICSLLVKDMTEGVCLIRCSDLKIISANSAFEQMFGYLSGEFNEKHISILNGSHSKLAEEIIAQLKSQVNSSFEIKIIKNDQSTFFCLMRSYIYKHSKLGNIWVALFDNITARKKSEAVASEEEKKMLSMAQMSALGKMVSGLCHEVNTPLGVIQLNIDEMKDKVIKTGSIGPADMWAYSDLIESMLNRVVDIINNLRLFSRDAKDLTTKPIRVKNVIENTLKFCSEKFKNHDVDLQIIKISEDIVANCNSVELSEVILNLLQNAYEAIEDLPQKWINIEVKEKHKYFEFLITDSGTGVDSRVKEKLFEPFISTKSSQKNPGLGLSISKKIVENYQGRLWVDLDCPNTRFIFSLPKCENPKI